MIIIVLLVVCQAWPSTLTAQVQYWTVQVQCLGAIFITILTFANKLEWFMRGHRVKGWWTWYTEMVSWLLRLLWISIWLCHYLLSVLLLLFNFFYLPLFFLHFLLFANIITYIFQVILKDWMYSSKRQFVNDEGNWPESSRLNKDIGTLNFGFQRRYYDIIILKITLVNH